MEFYSRPATNANRWLQLAGILKSQFLNTKSLFMEAKKLLRNSSVKITLICIGLIVIGLLILPYTEKITDHVYRLIVEHVAAIFIAVCSLHIINEWLLKKDFIKIYGDQLSSAVNNALPSSFRRIKESGLVDVYEKINFDALEDNIKNAEKTEIIFLTFWIENVSRICNALINAINSNNCTVRILILDPKAQGTIEQRASSISMVGYSKDSIINNITENVEILNATEKKIDNNKKKNFQCRFYDDWISHSVYGVGENLLIGHYLANKLSTETHFIKVTGYAKPLFKELHNHFDYVWNKSTENEKYNIFADH
jgi:hypothetical protein